MDIQLNKLIVWIAIFLCAYAGWQYFSGRDSSSNAGPANPVYAEFRVKYPDEIELVGFGKMDSMEDCQARAEIFWRDVLASDANTEMTAMKCGAQLPVRFQALFENRPAHATYIAMDRGNAGERDGRFIVYGAPSSEVMKHCPAFIDSIKKKYAGEVKCIQGSIG
jgi:hypothetical protein